MAVRLSSDLIVDVMKAADPAQVQMAAAKLNAKSKSGEGTLFTDALKALREPAAARLAESREPDAYGQFESFMMRQAFEDMMPPAKSQAFGEGFAGGVWRSMAAEQFASIFTEHGGLGIAEMLRAKAKGEAEPAPLSGQWPYYNAPAISAFMSPIA